MSDRKFLEFRISDQTFGIDVNMVQEVTNPIEPRPIPEVSDFITGVAIFRNQPVVLLDLRKRFQTEKPSRGRLIVLKPEKDYLGLVVDEVIGIKAVSDQHIRKPERLYRGIKTKFIEGLYDKDEDIVVVLHIENLLESKEKIKLKKAIKAMEAEELR